MKTVTLGEIMLRLSPPEGERLFESPALRGFFGGTEANVAVGLAHFGLESFYVTRLPENPIGQAALAALRAEGVRTDYICRGGRRLGLYFAELATDTRPMRVTYDRTGSAASEMDPGEIDWTAVFEGAVWFHTTGITPALGPKALATTRAALAAARAAGATVSFDVNYRHQLWTPEDAQATLRPLMEHVDVLIANRDALANGLGIELPREDLRPAAAEVAWELGLAHLAITLRDVLSETEHEWSAVLFEPTSGELFESRCHRVRLVDRVGAGDAFAAGLILGLASGWTAPRVLEFAAAAGALQHSVPGDFSRFSVEEVERRPRPSRRS